MEDEPKILFGYCKWYDDSKGFGFLREDGSDVDYFCHCSTIIPTREENFGNGRPWYGLEEGACVSFQSKGMGKRGTMVAFNVKALNTN